MKPDNSGIELGMQQEDIAKIASILLEQRKNTPNDPIENLFNSPIPAELWNYTSVSALKGILSSGTVWATEAHFTTDETEFVYIRDVALDFLTKLSVHSEEDEQARQLAISVVTEEFDRGALSQEGAEVFVVSFSSAENLKSQWTEYADVNRGVSIAFDLRHIRPPEELQVAVTLAPCIYEEADKIRLIDATLRHFMRAASSIHKNTGSRSWAKEQLTKWQLINRIYGLENDLSEFKASLGHDFTVQLRSALTLIKYDMLRLASHCKNSYFREEREWRLALPHRKGSPLTHIEIQHRGPKNQIPYVAHNLFCEERLPIARVMVGPLCEEYETIQEMLKTYGYDVLLSRATSPLRRAYKI